MPSQQIAVIQNDVEKLMNEISEVECNKLLEVVFIFLFLPKFQYRIV